MTDWNAIVESCDSQGDERTLLVAERQDQIHELVNSRGSIRVTELSEHFNVTEETIRRDLDALEERGLLRRSHGGAVKVTQREESPYTEREIVHGAQKLEIAREALKWVVPGDQIALDASSTTTLFAAALPNIPIKVVTNSIKVAVELHRKDRISVMVVGGNLSARSLSMLGPSAEQAIDRYHVNRVFLSCKGVHLGKGISESNEMQALVKQKLIEIADDVVLLADHSKFGVQDFTTICSLSRVNRLITDSGLDDETLTTWRSYGVDVVRAAVR